MAKVWNTTGLYKAAKERQPRQHGIARSLAKRVHVSRDDMTKQVQPRDEFERAVINALGDISWSEAMEAINKHRAAPTVLPVASFPKV